MSELYPNWTKARDVILVGEGEKILFFNSRLQSESGGGDKIDARKVLWSHGGDAVLPCLRSGLTSEDLIIDIKHAVEKRDGWLVVHADLPFALMVGEITLADATSFVLDAINIFKHVDSGDFVMEDKGVLRQDFEDSIGFLDDEHDETLHGDITENEEYRYAKNGLALLDENEQMLELLKECKTTINPAGAFGVALIARINKFIKEEKGEEEWPIEKPTLEVQEKPVHDTRPA